jgi:hypothetical protein
MTAQEKIALRLLQFDQQDLPLLRAEIMNIGPSVQNAKECLLRMHTMMTFIVRHNLLALANTSPQALSVADKEANNEAVLAALSSLPPGVTATVDRPPGVQQSAVTVSASTQVTGRHIEVVVGQDVQTISAAPDVAEPEASDVPTVVIGRAGTKVIPPRGSGQQVKTLAAGAPVDLTLPTDDPEPSK